MIQHATHLRNNQRPWGFISRYTLFKYVTYTFIRISFIF